MPDQTLFDLILTALDKQRLAGQQYACLSTANREFLFGAPASGPAKDSRPPARPAPKPAAPAPKPRPAPKSPGPASLQGDASVLADLGQLGMPELTELVSQCERCQLCREGRTQTVFGVGDPQADLMFIGEGPGADEDRQGIPFVGRAGKLLTKIIEAMGLAREQVYIANIVKCRPPGNRNPDKDEAAACLPYLQRQIQLIQPRIIVTLGATPMLYLLGLKGIMKLRGQWQSYQGVAVMPTLHPAYLLRNPPAKREVWEDMQLVMRELGLKPPPR